LNEFFEEENFMDDSEETHIRHAFDSFCKKVVRNEALNIQKKYARFRQRQISMEILEHEGLGTEFYYSEPDMNSSEIFIVLGIKIFISNEELANAIAALPSVRQEIILMSFFIGLNDREIGDIIGKSLGSVWYQRQVALEELGKYLGGIYEAK
jgi:DNA-directed RNA polymerase specialized sigma24 family protein